MTTNAAGVVERTQWLVTILASTIVIGSAAYARSYGIPHRTAVHQASATVGSGIVATLHSTRLQHPFALAVDERTRRVFAVGLGPLNGSYGPSGRATVSTLDAATGRIVRTTTIGTMSGLPIPYSIAVDERTRRVFVANYSTASPLTATQAGFTSPGSVSVLDAATGKLLRTVHVGPGPLALAVAESTNRVFVLNSNADVHYVTLGPSSVSVLDATTGTLLRTVPIPLARGWPGGAGPYVAAVDERAERVVMANDDQQLVILDARTGAVLTATSRVIGCGLAADAPHGRVIVQDALGRASYADAIDLASGRVLYRAYLPKDAGPCPGRTVAMNERTGQAWLLGFPSQHDAEINGTVFVVDPLSGAILHATDLPIRSIFGALALDTRTGRAFVVTDDRISVFAGGDRLVRTIAVPTQPYGATDVAVCAATGRVFVAIAYSNTITVLDTAMPATQ